MRAQALAALACLTIAGSAMAQQVVIPPHQTVYNGFTRGFNFTAATSFFIVGLDLPLDAFQAGDTSSYMVRVNGNMVLRDVGGAGPISTNITVNIGDVVDILGNWSPATTGNFTAHNSYGEGGFATTINGVAHTLTRTGWQWDIGDPNWTSGAYLAPTGGQLGRVLMTTAPIPAPAGLALLGLGGLIAVRRRR